MSPDRNGPDRNGSDRIDQTERPDRIGQTESARPKSRVPKKQWKQVGKMREIREKFNLGRCDDIY